MDTVVVIASVVVGLVFLVAGGSKIAAGPQWPVEAAELGAPRFSVAVLPWIELTVGALLVVQVARPYPAYVALALLVGFTLLIVRRLAQGKRPACACFGAWSAKPLGAGHVARNTTLIIVAVIALF